MKKKGIEMMLNTLVYLILAIVILVLTLVIYSIMTGKANGALEFLKNILRFGK